MAGCDGGSPTSRDHHTPRTVRRIERRHRELSGRFHAIEALGDDRHTGNPFNNGIVADAWPRPIVNVSEIARDVFDLPLASLADVRTQRRRRSILIHGAPGSGKTHLLARLRAAVTAETPDKPPARGSAPSHSCTASARR